MELVERQVRLALRSGSDVTLTFHDGSVMRARIVSVDEASFGYVVPPLPPTRAAFGDVRRVRLVR